MPATINETGMRSSPKHYHWDLIQKHFVQGELEGDGRRKWPTLKEICQEYGCSYSQARRYLLDEDWLGKRREYKIESKRRVLDKAIGDYEKAASHFEASCLEAAQLGLDHILYHFKQVESDERVMDGVQLDRLSRAIVSYQRAGRLVLGLSTENNQRFKVEEVAKSGQLDLTKLTEKELQVLEILAGRIEEREALEASQEKSSKSKSSNEPIPISSKMRNA